MRFFAELHDAQLERFGPAGDEVAFRVLYIPVFVDGGMGHVVVWSYGGVLRIKGAGIDSGQQGSTGQLSEVVGVPNLIELQKVGDELVRRFRWAPSTLMFCDGWTVELTGGDAVLTLGRKQDRLEEWNGPIWGQEASGDVLLL